MSVEADQSVGCAQVRGGNGQIDVPIALPGLRGVLRSTPSDGGRGGDVYYLSVCGSGLLTRICLADLAGHGERVAGLAGRLHGLLLRFVSRPDHRRILGALNRSLVRLGLDAMTTAAVLTYYPPTRRLSYTYAGHPPGWFYVARTRRWERLSPAPAERPERDELIDGVLGVTERIVFTRSRRRAEYGDRLLLLTDGVLEAMGPDGSQFGAERLERVLADLADATPGDLATGVADALAAHRRGSELEHDDVTILLLEFEPGPPGPALWHVVRNRVLRPLTRSAAGRGAGSEGTTLEAPASA